MDFLIFVGVIGGSVVLFAGIPAGILIGITLLITRRRGSAPVWLLYVATAMALTCFLVAVPRQQGNELKVFLALSASLILLLPVPMMLDVDIVPGVRLGRRALIALGVVLGLALLLSGPVAWGLLGFEGP